ncbi:MAG TPA: hypothetical protein VMU95_03015 [Trebonia sp.]|nr:hypothetical protein [Trebonia sp.]
MTDATMPASADAQQAAIQAALLVLEKMGLTPADLAAGPRQRQELPTFAEYVPVVSAAVTPGTRRAYGSYWNRVVEQWLGRPGPRTSSQKTHPPCRRTRGSDHRNCARASFS